MKAKVFFFILISCLTLACCSDEDESSRDKILGHWVLTDATYKGKWYTVDELRVGGDFVLRSNGDCYNSVTYMWGNPIFLGKWFMRNDTVCCYKTDSDEILYYCIFSETSDVRTNIQFIRTSDQASFYVKVKKDEDFYDFDELRKYY